MGRSVTADARPAPATPAPATPAPPTPAPAAMPDVRRVRDELEKLRPQIARALPTAVPPERFLRLVFTELRETPELANCSLDSLFGVVMKSAQLGLEPGAALGQCWYIPFRDNKAGTVDATFILGYKGIVRLAHRSPEVKDIFAREVCERDQFRFAYGLEDYLEHVPAREGRRGPAVAFYGVCHFTGGGHYFLVMNRDEVEERRERSRSKDRGPWVSDYNAMGRKTVVRAMAPFIPLTPEATRALAHDDQVLRWSDSDDVFDVPAGDA